MGLLFTKNETEQDYLKIESIPITINKSSLFLVIKLRIGPSRDNVRQLVNCRGVDLFVNSADKFNVSLGNADVTLTNAYKYLKTLPEYLNWADVFEENQVS